MTLGLRYVLTLAVLVLAVSLLLPGCAKRIDPAPTAPRATEERAAGDTPPTDADRGSKVSSRGNSLPTGASVVDRSVEETGGAESHSAVRTRILRGKLSMPAMGIAGPLTLWQKEPDLHYMEVELPGLGTMTAGHDGEIVWQKDPMTGPRILEGAERASQLRDAEINPAAWRKSYSGAETVSLEQVDGKPAYKVVLTPNEGNEVTHYYDRENGLLVKAESIAETQMGDVPVITHVEDYRESGGLLLPFTLRQEVMGMEQRFEFESVEDNVELPVDRFEPPAEIRTLEQKRKAAPTG